MLRCQLAPHAQSEVDVRLTKPLCIQGEYLNPVAQVFARLLPAKGAETKRLKGQDVPVTKRMVTPIASIILT
jgi:hypothetical protein